MSWRDRFPDEVTCVRCLERRSTDDVDRLLWCDDCRERARARAGLRGWLAGAVVAGLFAAWLYLWVRPDRDLILGGWVATIVAAFWISARIGRELFYGIDRFRNRRAREAVPPQGAPGDGAGYGEDAVGLDDAQGDGSSG